MSLNESLHRQHFKDFGLETEGSSSNLRYIQTNVCPIKEHPLPEGIQKVACTIQENTEMGFALVGKRKHSPKFPAVEKFLRQKYEEGKTGRTFKPSEVELLMRRDFPIEMLKTASQIKTIFSKFKAEEKQPNPTEEQIQEAGAELDADYESSQVDDINQRLESRNDGCYLSGHPLQVSIFL